MRKRLWFVSTPILFFAAADTGLAATGTGDAGGAGTGTGSTGVVGAGGGGSAQTVTTPSAPEIKWDTAPAQFREAFNALKSAHEKLSKEYEPWKSFGSVDDVSRFRDGYNGVYNEVKSISQQLQIAEGEVADAIKQHGLVKVLDHLRNEVAQAESARNGDPAAVQEQELQERIDNLVRERLSPIEQRENTRITHEANTLTENTITQLASDAFKAQGLDWNGAPNELRDFILTGVTEVLKYDDAAMKDIKFGGKTAGIQKAFQTFSSMFDAAYLARRGMESRTNPAPRSPRAPAQPGAKKPTLDEMLDNPDSIRTAQGKPAYAS